MTRGLRWTVTLALGLAAGLVLTRLRVPGGLLVGPLVAGVALAVTGRAPGRVPRLAMTAGQATIGCIVAAAFAPATVATLARDIVPLLAVVLTTVAAAAIVAFVLARSNVLDPVTAAWGSSPGGAAAMTAMSLAEGADARLVAFQQYLRVTIVVLSAAGVARILGVHAPAIAAQAAAAPALLAVVETAAIGVAGAWLAIRLRITAGALLGPLLLGAACEATGIVHLVVPSWALVAAYVAIGLAIGLQYTRETLRYALRALPWLALSTLLLTALCGLSAVLLVLTLHVDPLTAYLATTPGGLDSVTVIALGSGANISLVLALQSLRLLVVVLSGPPLARLIARVA